MPAWAGEIRSRFANYGTVMGNDLIAWGLIFAPLILIYGSAATVGL